MDTNRFKTNIYDRSAAVPRPFVRRDLQEILPPSQPLQSHAPAGVAPEPALEPRYSHKQYEAAPAPEMPPQPVLEGQTSAATTISIRLSIPQLGRFKLPTRVRMTQRRWLLVGLFLWIIFTLGYQMGRHHPQPPPAAMAPTSAIRTIS